MNKLHALDILGHDPEGDRYRHELLAMPVGDDVVLCAECGASATVQHAGRAVVWQCRLINLCGKTRCLVAHAVRHDRALHDQETREAEAAGARKRRVA